MRYILYEGMDINRRAEIVTWQLWETPDGTTWSYVNDSAGHCRPYLLQNIPKEDVKPYMDAMCDGEILKSRDIDGDEAFLLML